jgi:hypothetical protein
VTEEKEGRGRGGLKYGKKGGKNEGRDRSLLIHFEPDECIIVRVVLLA